MSWLVVVGDALRAGACKCWRQHNGISTLGIYSNCYHCSLSIQFLCVPLDLSMLGEILVVNDASEHIWNAAIGSSRDIVLFCRPTS
jgi:hypothetical protein